MLADPSNQNWKMPLARTQSGGNYGLFPLFPNRPIYLDFDAITSGIGTAASPINSLATLFADDNLECVCQELCCNKITVKIKGTFANAGGENEIAVDGLNRDYAGNLVIEPWNTSCILNGSTVITGSENTVVLSEISFFENLSGVIFRNLTFNWLVSSEKPADSTEKSGLGLIGELNGFKNCSNLRFINCSISQVVRIDFAVGDYGWKPADNEAGKILIDEEILPEWNEGNYGIYFPRGVAWGGGGYGRGRGGGGGGGSGWGDGGTAMDETCKVFFTAANFRECTSIQINNCTLKTDIDLRSNAGARGWAFNLLATPFCDIDDIVATATSQTYDARAGEEKDGEILPYSLVADSIVSGLANCSNSSLLRCQFATTAGATATPINTPTNGNIGGQSKAESYAILNGVNFAAGSSTLTSIATAIHPARWAYMADPSFETVIDGTGNTLSDSYRRDSEGQK